MASRTYIQKLINATGRLKGFSKSFTRFAQSIYQNCITTKPESLHGICIKRGRLYFPHEKISSKNNADIWNFAQMLNNIESDRWKAAGRANITQETIQPMYAGENKKDQNTHIRSPDSSGAPSH